MVGTRNVAAAVGNGEELPIDVAREMTRIFRNWRILKRKAGRQSEPVRYSPYEAPSGYLKREIYGLAAELIVSGDTELARGYARLQDRRVADESSDGPDLYRWLLSGLGDNELSKSEKRRYAHELHYARRHRVTPEILVGFLYQAGAGQDIYRRAIDATVVEPWCGARPRPRLRAGR